MGFPSILGILFLPLNQLKKILSHTLGRHHQFIPYKGFGIAGKHIKYRSGILAKFLVTGQKATVCIKPGRVFIVITGPQMDISANPRLFSSHYQSDLSMGFQTGWSIDHVTSGFFQHHGPAYILLLIEAGL